MEVGDFVLELVKALLDEIIKLEEILASSLDLVLNCSVSVFELADLSVYFVKT